jgi:hypothetical protein
MSVLYQFAVLPLDSKRCNYREFVHIHSEFFSAEIDFTSFLNKMCEDFTDAFLLSALPC